MGFYIPITPPIDQVYLSKTSSLKVELGVVLIKNIEIVHATASSKYH
jgi:hypothetical protein